MQRSDVPSAPLGSWLLGSTDENPRRRRIRVQLLLTAPLLITNLIGAGLAIILIGIVVPGPSIMRSEFALINFIAVPVFIVCVFIVGLLWGTKRLMHDLRWATEDTPPSEENQRAALRGPWRLTRVQLALWTVALATFTTLYGIVDADTIPKVLFTIAFSGITTCAFCYLLSEFALRPIAARALESGAPRKSAVLGLTGRTILIWVLGSGVPVAGLMIVAIFSYIRPPRWQDLAISILVIGGITLCVGLGLTYINIRSAAAPIQSVRRGMEQVTRGDFSAQVVVYDGTELGLLQTGFNRMAEGLRERERIRDLFGRHVGYEVAANAMRRNPELGGEERDVSVLFVDVIGSTTIAATNSPTDVVTLLNRFFDVIVDEVDAHGGFVNKFEGDAALAIFGAPSRIDDHAGCALAAARKIQVRLCAEVPEISAGIGVASGIAVAGNVGARERFEYTVIGDPVNEAARLSEVAKNVPGNVAASGRALASASESERIHWVTADSIVLRGRTQQTVLAVPVTSLEAPNTSA
ncbi:adenylate/guanylate cyclase domain-containing protein [Rhodococcus sp. ARC_M6]|uniref:adenylate/guanylate cyclase domain-containing protein n=1 Tax=Rhodococcus sp. ARC_M6 TaxID=2928852 RepID=UPI001FB558D0|nr:adenylate/guanylate cyclase domain-containing protein [Rhodococcus sp. ARC_M6]MCJ0903122.1 HAMP domain-containing protein [Rhodococcus sp. ARC_M6]